MSLDFLHVWHACVFLITSLFIYHGGCLTEPRAFDDLAGWLSLGVPVSASFEAGIPDRPLDFYVGAGIQILVLMLGRQVLYSLNHFPRLN